MKNIQNQEAEIKLSLSEPVYKELKELCASSKEKIQENSFFDTKDQRLLREKWTLRIRIEDSSAACITVKGPGIKEDALFIRTEYETGIPVAQASLLQSGFYLHSIRLLPCIELEKQFGDCYVEKFLSFTNHRISFPWKEWEIELDKTMIDDMMYYELECEIDPEKKDAATDELKSLFKSHSWEYMPSPMSKFRRALQMNISKTG